MSASALSLLFLPTAILVALIAVLLMRRSTAKPTTSSSAIDHVRCLELSTQWNHALLEQVAELSKQSEVMREALNFYAEPHNWIAPSRQEQSRAFDDRGETARLALRDQRIEPTSSTHPTQ